MSTSAETVVARRPGGRTAEVTHRVHDAILELLVEGGAQACTFTAVAERAGIERSTLYRRFPDRWEAIIDALMDFAAKDVLPDLGRSFVHDLRSVLRKLRDALESPLGPALLAVAIELQSGSGAYPRAYFDRRLAQLQPMFDAAIARGELSPDVDCETLFTFAAGPIYFRKFIAARPLDDAFVDQIVDNVLRLYCS
ncbi:MAG TPA: TetR/AcrR family transcriptional regulator [Sphingomicrobium sp.]